MLIVSEKIRIDPRQFCFPADSAGAFTQKCAERKRFADGVVDAVAGLFDAIDDPVSDVADIDVLREAIVASAGCDDSWSLSK